MRVIRGVQHQCLTHETGGNNQVHHANAEVVERIHLRHQRLRTPAELGIADQNGSDRAGFVLPIVGGAAAAGEPCGRLR